MRRVLALSSVLVFLASGASLRAEDGLVNIHDLPGGIVSSYGNGVSDDGRIIAVAGTNASGYAAAIWTAENGYTLIGELPGGTYQADVGGMSADGRYVTGASFSANGYEAFLWSAQTGLIGLGDLAGGTFESYGADVSLGGMVVGLSRSANGFEAFTWTATGGMVGYGDLAGGAFDSGFTGVTLDGSKIVGYGTDANGTQAMYWTQNTGMVGLGDFAGGAFESYAERVSNDGSVIIGHGNNASGQQAFRWTQATGMVGLGELPGGAYQSAAYGVSGDGKVVVGYSESAAGQEAFRWSEGTGMITVADWLAANGHPVTGWIILDQAYATNYNGSVITGSGTTASGYETYIATIGGVVTPDDVAESLGSVAAAPQLGQQMSTLSMNGAHHRILYDQGINQGTGCVWVNADGGHSRRNDTNFKLAEAGACADINEDLRIGAGIGKSTSKSEDILFSSTEASGQYAVAEADYKIPGTPLIAAVTGIAGHWDADIRRGYVNAGMVDYSNGDTNLQSQSVRFRLEARNVAHIADISITPRVDYTLSRTHMDGYTETGGGFPAQFDSQTNYAHEARIGVTGATPLTENTDIALTLEGVHRFDDNYARTSGQVLGLFAFDQQGRDIDQTWARAGLDADYRLTPSRVISFSAHAATNGEDPDYSGSVSYKQSLGN